MSVELDYGPAPKHFLEEDATPEQLFEYAQEFHEKFAKKQPGSYSIGMTNHVPGEVYVTYNGDHYYFGFYNDGEVRREYEVYKNHFKLIYPARENLPQETNGQHAWFITAHLRTAGIIRLREQGLLKSSGH